MDLDLHTTHLVVACATLGMFIVVEKPLPLGTVSQPPMTLASKDQS